MKKIVVGEERRKSKKIETPKEKKENNFSLNHGELTPQPKSKQENGKKEIKSAPPKSLNNIDNFLEKFEELEKKKKKRKRNKKEENGDVPKEIEISQKEPIDYEELFKRFPTLNREPKEGDHIAFKMLELNKNGIPQLSEFKVRFIFLILRKL